jgi:hypothetical protein
MVNERLTAATNAFDPAIERDILGIPRRFGRRNLRRRHRRRLGSLRCAVARSSIDGLGRAKRDHRHGDRK